VRFSARLSYQTHRSHEVSEPGRRRCEHGRPLCKTLLEKQQETASAFPVGQLWVDLPHLRNQAGIQEAAHTRLTECGRFVESQEIDPRLQPILGPARVRIRLVCRRRVRRGVRECCAAMRDNPFDPFGVLQMHRVPRFLTRLRQVSRLGNDRRGFVKQVVSLYRRVECFLPPADRAPVVRQIL
jgi:hypothetical protein